MVPIHVQRLSYKDLQGHAESLLKKHNQDSRIPVPIEHIVEFGFQINIIPLHELLTVHEVDAFTSKNLQTIFVDHSVLQSRSANRYRFSLAHELGHIVLHADVFAEIHFANVAEWKRVIVEMSEADREWLEWQAYSFAGLVLAPVDPLKQSLEEAIKIATDRGFDIQENSDVAKDYVCTWLGRQFEVSAQVIEKRLDKDGLWRTG